MSSNKKKAFTLTELLVVVIVIGVLSAVVLPKFSKVMETRKTTEAELLMKAVRSEQEKRCSLDKHYLAKLTDVKDVLPNSNTKYFTYSLTSTGIEAQSKGKYDYSLKIPSYHDGRICCDNAAECAKLNKDYPLCSDLVARSDYRDGKECEAVSTEKQCTGASSRACGCKNGGTQTRVCDTTTGSWGSWSACTVPDACNCEGADTQACGCLGKGTQSRTCNTSTGSWNAWGSCSVADACNCTAVSGPKPQSLSQECNKCGTRTNSFTCNTSNGTWTESWSQCSVSDPSECAQDCPRGKTWDGTKCVCDNIKEKDWCVFEVTCDDGSLVMETWNDETCSCDANCAEPDPNKPTYYFKCVSRGTGFTPVGKYSSMAAAQQACISGQDTGATFNRALDCPMPPPNKPMPTCYYIHYTCSTEPPRPASGYGFDETRCVIVQPHA